MFKGIPVRISSKKLRIVKFVVICGLVTSCYAKPKKVKCPDYCICDIFENLNRATCMNKTIYSIEIDMPPQAEILNLAYNQISELGNNIFVELGLVNLKLLNLTHNKVSQINLKGFLGLKKLKTLDLSYNALRYFMSFWFECLSSLEELYLGGNYLQSLSTEPLINLKYLKILDLSNCGITYISSETFIKLPNLEMLDVSDNFLTELDPEIVYPLKNLVTLRVKNNNFNCEEMRMARLKNYTLKSLIAYQDPCKKKPENNPVMFERMESDVAPERNIWLFDEVEEDSKKNTVKICDSERNITNEKKDFLVEIIMLSPWLAVCIIFITGLFLGLIIGCAVEIVPKQSESMNDNERFPDGHWIMAGNSIFDNPLPVRKRANSFSNMRTLSRSLNRLSRSISVRKDPKDEGESLTMADLDWAYSTPMFPRKSYI